MILTPMEYWCWSCFARGRGLVNGSATFRSVCILQISMSPSTKSRMELKRLLMCSVFLWNLDSFAKAIALVLSQRFSLDRCTRYYTKIGYEFLHPYSFICCFRSSYVFRLTRRSRHDALFRTAPTDSSTVQCKHYPVCDLESSGSVSKLAST